VHDDFPFDFAVIDVSLSEFRTDNEQSSFGSVASMKSIWLKIKQFYLVNNCE